MKKVKDIMTILAATVLTAGCAWENATANKPGFKEYDCIPVSFSAGMEQKTRVDEVSSLSTFNCLCTKNGTSLWHNKTFTSKDAGSTYESDGVYWDVASDAQFAFYAANAEVTFSEGKGNITVTKEIGDNKQGRASTDYVTAYLDKDHVVYGTTNTLTFGHILSRIKNITMTAETGYTISNVRIEISNPIVTPNTYNITDGVFTNPTRTTAMSLSTGLNDVYLIPGTVTMSVTYDISMDDWAASDIIRTKEIVLAKGCCYSISGVLDASNVAKEFEFNMTLEPWGDSTVNIDEWD